MNAIMRAERAPRGRVGALVLVLGAAGATMGGASVEGGAQREAQRRFVREAPARTRGPRRHFGLGVGLATVRVGARRWRKPARTGRAGCGVVCGGWGCLPWCQRSW